MNYYIGKVVSVTFDEAIEKVTEELKKEGFGVLTEIDMQATMKKKLDKDINKYRILGACNPDFAYQALQHEKNIGVMLPCNVIVQEHDDKSIEVSAVSPLASMMAIENEALKGMAGDVEAKLQNVINAL